jgi:hypothetical protein
VSVIPTDFLGADINEGSSSDSESSDSEISVTEKSDRESSKSEEVGEVLVVGVLQERGDEAAKPSKQAQMERKMKQQKSKEQETYEVSEFVTAVYGGEVVGGSGGHKPGQSGREPCEPQLHGVSGGKPVKVAEEPRSPANTEGGYSNALLTALPSWRLTQSFSRRSKPQRCSGS